MLLVGRVLTFDPRFPEATALVTAGDRIIDVGSAADLRARYPAERRFVVEMITPGLHDSHVHPLQWGMALSRLDLRGRNDPREVAHRVREEAANLPRGEWIRGGGFVFGDYPDSTLLDEAAPHNPVFLESRDLHSAWVNRTALALAGINDLTPDPPGGKMLRDDSGCPTGYLLERAVRLVQRVLPPPKRQDLSRGLEDLARRGFVAVHAMGEVPEATIWIRELALAESLPVRVAWVLQHSEVKNWEPEKLGDYLHIFGAKFFADGALTSRTAWMRRPYPGGGFGMPVDDPREVDSKVIEVLQRGFAPVWHAIGTRAIQELLNMITRVAAAGLSLRSVVRIEHVQHVGDEDIQRLAGMALSVQPQHAADDLVALEALGDGSVREAYRWGEMARLRGVRVLLGSDAPVAVPDPGETLKYASAHPLPGAEGMPRHIAIRGYVHDPAAYLGWDKERYAWGKISAGSRAALTLWEDGTPIARLWRGYVEPVTT